MNRTHALRRCAHTLRSGCWLGLWLWAMALCPLAQAAPMPPGTALEPIALDGRMRSLPLAQHSMFWVDPT